MRQNRFAVRNRDDITGTYARQIGRFPFHDAFHVCALRHTVFFRCRSVNRTDRNADPGTLDESLCNQYFHDLLNLIDRQRKTDSLSADRIAQIVITCGDGLRAVDTDDLSVEIDQRSAAVAEVDRGIGLQIGVGVVVDRHFAFCCADDAERDRICQLVRRERVTDGEYIFANANLVRIAQLQRLQLNISHFEHGDIRLVIRADQRCRAFDILAEYLDRDFARAFYDVRIGQNITLAGDDKTCAAAIEFIDGLALVRLCLNIVEHTNHTG